MENRLSIRVENNGAIVRAFRGERCLATALMRRAYDKGPLWTLATSDGAPAGTHDGPGMRITLRKVALRYERRLADEAAVAGMVRDFTAAELSERLTAHEASEAYRLGESHAASHALNLRRAIFRRVEMASQGGAEMSDARISEWARGEAERIGRGIEAREAAEPVRDADGWRETPTRIKGHKVEARNDADGWTELRCFGMTVSDRSRDGAYARMRAAMDAAMPIEVREPPVSRAEVATPGPYIVRGETAVESPAYAMGIDPAREDAPGGFPYFIRQDRTFPLGSGPLWLACGIQRLADARLFAAAPDMAEALGAVLRCPQAAMWLALLPVREGGPSTWDAIGAALTKAGLSR